MSSRTRRLRPSRQTRSVVVPGSPPTSSAQVAKCPPQIDVAVNATEAGTIKELLVGEEDTVTVGQDLARIEPGAAPEGGAEKPAPKEDAKEPEPAPKSEPPAKEAEPAPKPEKPASAPPKQEAPAAPAPKPQAPTQPPAPAKAGSEGLQGSREERRVSDSESLCSVLPNAV